MTPCSGTKTTIRRCARHATTGRSRGRRGGVDEQKVEVVSVRLNGRGQGTVQLSNGAQLGRVRSVQMVSHAGEVADLVLTLHAVTIHVDDDQGQGRGQTSDPSPA